jgi:hypothetical protein
MKSDFWPLSTICFNTSTAGASWFAFGQQVFNDDILAHILNQKLNTLRASFLIIPHFYPECGNAAFIL